MTPEPLPDANPARWLGRPLHEMRWSAELTRLLVDPVFHGHGVPHGKGGRVLLLPGFGGGDHLLAPMALWLRRIGYGVSTCGIWLDTSCSEQAMLRIERRVQELADHNYGRVAIVGHSRGGYLAKALAARRPDQVSHVVTLGSGLSSPLDVAAPGSAQWRWCAPCTG